MINEQPDAYAKRVLSYGKYMLEMPQSGPVSFLHTNLCEDWSQIDIALLGIPSDAGLTQRTGARFGPQAIRQQSALLRHINTSTKVIPYELARVGDIGDVPFKHPLNLDPLVQDIFHFYEKIRDAGLFPLTAGGDHSITYPILKALGAKQPLGLIHIDTHYDTVGESYGTKFHHGGPFRNALLDGAIDPKRAIQIGIHDPFLETANDLPEALQMTVLHIDEVVEMGIPAVIKQARQIVGDGPTYISFDIDAIDPAFAPGTGAPVVGGFTVREVLQLLQGFRGVNIVGADVVEVSPQYDLTGTTALIGAQMMFEILCLMAEAFDRRKKLHNQ